jgi:hypothetical protein
MHHTTSTIRPIPQHGSEPAAAPRHDLYGTIHKALRALMHDSLLRLGRLDVGDAADLQATLGQLDGLRALFASHLEHENRFVHPAIEARRPGGAAATADAHRDHLDTLQALGEETAALRAAAVPQRAALASRLYRHLALFVAENLEHMALEESANNAELQALHGRLLASVDPREMVQVLDWMARSLNPQELAELMSGLKHQVPPEGMRVVLMQTRACLDDTRWRKLTTALGLALDVAAVPAAR